MRGHGAKFSRKMEEAVVALLSQRNQEEAARVDGVGVATLLRWQKLPEFQAAYRMARRQAVGQAVARLQQTTAAAVTTLQKLMVDSNTAASIKARVAEAILALAPQGHRNRGHRSTPVGVGTRCASFDARAMSL